MPPNQKKENRVTTLRLPKDLLDLMDELVKAGIYPSKNQMIKEALERLLKNLAISLEVRYLAEQELKKSANEKSPNTTMIFQTMGKLLKEKEEELSKSNPAMTRIGTIIEMDPTQAYHLSRRILEVIEK